MGQRLNLEIVKSINNKDEVLANAYYHWSGYTRSANHLANIVLEEIQNTDSKIMEIEDNKLKAIRLLELTGALITSTEYSYISSLYQNEEFEIASSRNDGLIATSPNGVEVNRRSEEGRITIYLDELLINANCHWVSNNLEEFVSWEDDEDKKYEKINFIKSNTLIANSLEELSVDEFKKYCGLCEKASETRMWAFTLNNNENFIIDIIE